METYLLPFEGLFKIDRRVTIPEKHPIKFGSKYITYSDISSIFDQNPNVLEACR